MINAALMRRRIAMLFLAVGVGWLWLDARAQSNVVVRGAHRFEKVAEGIYYTTASGTMPHERNSAVRPAWIEKFLT